MMGIRHSTDSVRVRRGSIPADGTSVTSHLAADRRQRGRYRKTGEIGPGEVERCPPKAEVVSSNLAGCASFKLSRRGSGKHIASKSPRPCPPDRYFGGVFCLKGCVMIQSQRSETSDERSATRRCISLQRPTARLRDPIRGICTESRRSDRLRLCQVIRATF